MANGASYRKIVSERYKKVVFFKGYECTYCGRDAGTIDHVPSMLVSYLDKPETPHLKVPCCRMCNSLLGSRSLNTLDVRCRYLRERYEKKYKRDLEMPDWEDYEIAEMGPLAIINIKTSLKQRDAIEDVIYHLELAESIYYRIMEFNEGDFEPFASV